jgi:hypothetical protein
MICSSIRNSASMGCGLDTGSPWGDRASSIFFGTPEAQAPQDFFDHQGFFNECHEPHFALALGAWQWIVRPRLADQCSIDRRATGVPSGRVSTPNDDPKRRPESKSSARSVRPAGVAPQRPVLETSRYFHRLAFPTISLPKQNRSKFRDLNSHLILGIYPEFSEV